MSRGAQSPFVIALGECNNLAPAQLARRQSRMHENARCDHCEEEFAPEELVILDPPAGHGELICARCIEIELRRAIAKLPSEN